MADDNEGRQNEGARIIWTAIRSLAVALIAMVTVAIVVQWLVG